jgi:hypothetical protein
MEDSEFLYQADSIYIFLAKKKSRQPVGGRDNKKRRRHTLPHDSVVPSALKGLTALFGMGRGGHLRKSHHNILNTL